MQIEPNCLLTDATGTAIEAPNHTATESLPRSAKVSLLLLLNGDVAGSGDTKQNNLHVQIDTNQTRPFGAIISPEWDAVQPTMAGPGKSTARKLSNCKHEAKQSARHWLARRNLCSPVGICECGTVGPVQHGIKHSRINSALAD